MQICARARHINLLDYVVTWAGLIYIYTKLDTLCTSFAAKFAESCASRGDNYRNNNNNKVRAPNTNTDKALKRLARRALDKLDASPGAARRAL